MTSLEIVGLIATIFTTGAYLPQAVKIIKTKSTKSLSISTYLMIVVGSCLWVFYAYERIDLPVILANSVQGVLSVLILGMKLFSRERH